MYKSVTYQEIKDLPGLQWIDVRSEGEYAEATIPGALNIPLFSDEERARIGLVYHQQSPDEARLLGVDIVSPKIPAMVRYFKTLSKDKKIGVFCWRGGWRSQSVATLLALSGIHVFQLKGGYRSHRRYVCDYLSDSELTSRALVLHGLTGVGKTEILEKLLEAGEPVLDLENLARNRGSVFGEIGMTPPPTQKMFESLVVRELEGYVPKGYFFVECESRRVGRVTVPTLVMDAMQKGGHILLYTTMADRVRRLVRLYTEGSNHNLPGIMRALDSLQKRLGKEKTGRWKDLVQQGGFAEVARDLLVEYYDPLYKYPAEPSGEYDLSVSTEDPAEAVLKLKGYAGKLFPRRE